MIQLPDDFCRQTIAAIGEDEFQQLAEALSQSAPTSIRVNRGKASSDDVAQLLDGAENVEWCEQGYYLKERPQFTFDPLLHAGCYYVQEASSMVVGEIIKDFRDFKDINDLNDGKSLVVLDACAAPGGKSTLALDSLPTGSLLVANEYVRQRSHILVENLMKWGNPDIIVTNSDTRDFSRIEGLFDIIICDAPCSGEGMFRKDPKAIDEWSLDNVATCQMRQREIVRNLWPSLKPGGLFIYSTCTFNRFENEDNVAWLQDELGAVPQPPNPLKGALLCSEAGTPPLGGWGAGTHFYPHKSRGEGFFVAAFTKGDGDVASNGRKKRKAPKAAKVPSELKSWIDDAERFTVSQAADGSFHAFPTIYNNVLECVSEAAHVVHYGIQLAEQKGKHLQPCHSLALSQSLNHQAFHTEELDYATAIAYLRGEAIVLPDDCPRGIVVVAYKGHPLGFAKNIGNRANNLYPPEWRIKSTHVPVG